MNRANLFLCHAFFVLAAYFLNFFPISLAAFASLFALSFLFSDWLLAGDFGKVAKAAFAIVSTVVFLAWTVFASSLVLGYGVLSIALSFLILGSTILLVLPQKYLSKISAKALLDDFSKSARAEWPGITIAAFAFTAVLSIMLLTLWAPTPNGIIVGGWNYGDFFFHLPIVLSVNAGNFPPQTPYLAGTQLGYHWFMDFVSAISSKFLGTGPVDVIRFENALFVGLLVLLIYLLGLEISKDRKKAAFAALVVLFFGGLGFTKIYDAYSKNPSADILSLAISSPFDNDWKDFQVPSLLPGFLLDQRPLTVGLPVFILALLIFFASKRSSHPRAILAFAGVLSGLCMMFHFYTAPIIFLAFGLFVAASYWDGKISAGWIPWKNIAAFSMPLALAALPSILLMARADIRTPLLFELGWLAPKDLAGFAWFYLSNLGTAFAAFLIVFIALAVKFAQKKRIDENSKALAFLALLGFFLFAIPNVANLGSVGWDMVKFFAFMAVPAGLVASFAAYDFSAKIPRPFGTILLGAFFIVSCLTSILTTAWWWNNRWMGLDSNEVAAGEWILQNTLAGSVFVAAGVHNSPIDSIGARFRVIGYDGSSWLNAIGGQNAARRPVVSRVYCSEPPDSTAAIRELGAAYVYSSPKEHSAYSCEFQLEHDAILRKVYSEGGIEIYQVVAA